MWDLQSDTGVGKVDRDRNETGSARSWLLLKLGDGYRMFIVLSFFIYCHFLINKTFLRCRATGWRVCLVSDFLMKQVQYVIMKNDIGYWLKGSSC